MRVLITRPEPDATIVARELTSRGHDPLIAPLVDIVEYQNNLPKAQRISAYVVTSRNGIRALSRVTDYRKSLLYVVGSGTAEEAKANGYTKIIVGPGDASGLCKKICEELPPEEGLLIHISGRHLSYNICNELSSQGYDAERIILYDVKPKLELPYVAAKAFREKELDAILLFSPRIAQIFIELLCDADLQGNAIHFDVFCLSRNVAEIVARLNWRKVYISKAPNQISILSLLGVCTRIG